MGLLPMKPLSYSPQQHSAPVSAFAFSLQQKWQTDSSASCSFVALLALPLPVPLVLLLLLLPLLKECYSVPVQWRSLRLAQC